MPCPARCAAGTAQDNEGRWWTKDLFTGEWFYYDNEGTPVRGTPPVYEQSNSRVRPSSPDSKLHRFKPVARIVGLVMSIVGFGLYVGNESGFFVTFPYAGLLVGIVGAIILSLAIAPRRQR